MTFRYVCGGVAVAMTRRYVHVMFLEVRYVCGGVPVTMFFVAVQLRICVRVCVFQFALTFAQLMCVQCLVSAHFVLGLMFDLFEFACIAIFIRGGYIPLVGVVDPNRVSIHRCGSSISVCFV